MARDRVEQHRVEPVRPAAHRRFAYHRRHRDFPGTALEVDEVGLHPLVNAAEGCRQHVVELGLQFLDPAAADGDRLHDGHPELALERVRIELEAIALGEVDHV